MGYAAIYANTPSKERGELRNQITYLLWNGSLETTFTRAKEAARGAEKILTITGGVHFLKGSGVGGARLRFAWPVSGYGRRFAVYIPELPDRIRLLLQIPEEREDGGPSYRQRRKMPCLMREAAVFFGFLK